MGEFDVQNVKLLSWHDVAQLIQLQIPVHATITTMKGSCVLNENVRRKYQFAILVTKCLFHK